MSANGRQNASSVTLTLKNSRPLFGPVGPFPIVGGSLTLPGLLPPGLPPGPDLYMQWFVQKGSGGRQVSGALEFTIGLS